MNPILYEKSEDSFLNNGIGRLTDTIECRVTEERNGKYELEMKYPATGVHFDDIQNSRIIYARHSDALDLQPFRIYKIAKPLNGIVTVYARHISYDLLKMTVMPFQAESIVDALMLINQYTVSGSKFDFWTDKTTQAHFEVHVPTAIRSILGGVEGSILDVFGGGEYEFDHSTVKLHAQRGVDSGVTIRYGKNLQNFTQEINTEDVIIGVAPYWQGADEEKTVVTLPEGAIIAVSVTPSVLKEYYWDEDEQIYKDENGEGYEVSADTIGIVPLDLTSQFRDPPTVEQLRAATVAYLRSHTSMLEETENIKVSFTHLWQTEEYENVAPLQRLRLCDTATVIFPRYEVEVHTKVVKTVYNVLLERYDSMELGEPKSNLTKTISDQSVRIDSVKKEVESRNASMIAEAVNHATDLIQGGLGGHVVMKPNANGQPEEILIMDTDSIDTAINVIRLNKNGIAFSRDGYAGNYRTGWTIDGNFVADFITTGTLNANLIKTGTMSADRIYGGLLKVGGFDDENGILEIYDASDVRVGRWDKDSLYIGNIGTDLLKPNVRIYENGEIVSSSFIKSTKSSQYKVCQFNQAEISWWEYGERIGGINSSNVTPDTNKKGLALNVDSAGYNFIIGRQNQERTIIYRKFGYIAKAYENFLADRMYFFCKSIFDYELTANGGIKGSSLKITGSKSRVVDTIDYGNRLLYAYETASPMFGDVGEGKIGEDGKCYVQIDSIFSKTVALSQYQIFLQKYGEGDCWIEERNGSFFVVAGTPGLKFGWEMKAKQFDYDIMRLEKDNGDMETASKYDFGEELLGHISYIKNEREESLYENRDEYWAV